MCWPGRSWWVVESEPSKNFKQERLSWMEWEIQTNLGKFIRGALLLSHRMQEEPLCFLSSFAERSLVVAGSSPSPDFVIGLSNFVPHN